MYELVYQEEGTEHIVPLSSQECLLGRSPDCDIVVKDFGVSRHHAKVLVDGDTCRVMDLKSKNGTHVNGVLVLEAFLNEGDEISLGKFYLRFQRKLEEKVVLDEDKPMLEEEAGTVIRSVGDLQKYLEADKLEVPTSEAERVAVAPTEAAEIEKTNHILRSLSELAKALITAQPDQPEDVSELVMDAVFEHIPADRGFLMLLDEEGELKPRVVKNRHGGGEEGKITISKTIADRVVSDRVSILTSDAQVDPRFATGESIRFHGIRSAMCVPLWKGDQVIGIIHVDSPIQANTFTESDLDLLSALAYYSAIAIEQANLNRKVRKEKVARERLEKYFSPSFVTRIMSEGEMEVQELEATVLFADIVGFTPLAERLGDPRAVAEILNEYFSRMTDVIQEYDGAVDKFIGDCIMGVFGAPYWQEDHAVRAVRVALEMRDRLDDLNKEREGAGIQMRMGLNSGRVVAGPIGSQKRKEITVLGDPVNIASRIESAVAEAGQIVVGERTWELIKDYIETRDLGIFALKGKEKRVRCYEVLSEKPTVTEGT